ncbi:MAG TPA: response regulator transcription factor [Candidatus Obscuribacterales bacterium]
MSETRTEPTQRIKVLIVEDHEIVRMGIRLTLEQAGPFQIISEAADGNEAVEKALNLKPDVVLMDIGLPILSGIDAVRLIKEKLPQMKVLMITSHEDDDAVFAALSAGADGYCLKNILPPQLSMAIQSVLSGASWLDPGIAKRVFAIQQSKASEQMPKNIGKVGLTARELEVLALIVEGLNNQQIAEKLQIGSETVKTHVSHVMQKMVVADRTQAAVKALKDGYLR